MNATKGEHDISNRRCVGNRGYGGAFKRDKTRISFCCNGYRRYRYSFVRGGRLTIHDCGVFDYRADDGRGKRFDKAAFENCRRWIYH